jgi:hypothetical protein
VVAAPRAIVGADGHRDHAAEKDEKNLRGIAEAEPKNGDWNEGRFRQRIEQLHQRLQKQIERPPRRHRHTQCAADDNGE